MNTMRYSVTTIAAAAVMSTMAAGSTAFAQGVTDAQIAAIVVTANQVDVDAGRVAAARSSSDAV